MKKILFLCFCYFISVNCFTQNEISTAVPFLTIAPDARSGGLGETGVASTQDVNSMHWNLSKLAFAKKDYGASFSFTPWLRKLVKDMNVFYLAGYTKVNEKDVISASLKYFKIGEKFMQSSMGKHIILFKPGEFAADIGYARLLSSKSSIRITFRYIYTDLTSSNTTWWYNNYQPGQSFSGDLSYSYRTQLASLGINISNIGPKLTYFDTIINHNPKGDFLPANLRIGTAVILYKNEKNQIEFNVDANKLLVPTPPIYKMGKNGYYVYDSNNDPIIEKGRNPDRSFANALFTSFYDAPYGFKEEIQEIILNIGFEYMYNNQIFLRTGYFHEHEKRK